MKAAPFVLGLILAGLAGIASAALIQWNGAVSTDFEDGDNWVGGVAPANDTTTDTAYFAGAPTANQPVLTVDRSVRGVRFDSGGWTLGGGATLSPGTSAEGFHRSSSFFLNTAATNTVSCNVSQPTKLYTFTQYESGMLILSGVITTPSFQQDYGSQGIVRLAGTGSNAIADHTNQGAWFELAKTDGAIALFTGTSVGETSVSGLKFRWLESNQFAHPRRYKCVSTFTGELQGNDERFDRFYGKWNVNLDLAGGTVTFSGSDSLPVIYNHWDGAPTYHSRIEGPGTVYLTTCGDFSPRRATSASNPGYDLDISATITAGVSVASVSIARLGNYYTPQASVRFSAPAGNTYSQDTLVTRGRALIVENASGSATGTGNVYLKNEHTNLDRSTLAGSGIVAPAAGNKVYVQDKGCIAPGYGYNATDPARIATLTIQSDVVFETGSEIQFDIGATSGDAIVVSGALDLTGAPPITITTLAEPEADVYTLATFASRVGTVGAVTGVPENYKLLVKDDRIVLQYLAPGTVIVLQ